MKKHDITPGVDKFLPVFLPIPEDQTETDRKILRLHMDELSKPIRRSTYAPPAQDSSGRIAASLAVALLILATTAVIVHCSR
jgi:hypothetical protein